MNGTRSDDDKARCALDLRRHLQAAKALRQQARLAPDAAHQRRLLRQWQAQRLARSAADLLASERFAPAARFFLSDLYGPKDFSSRDEEIEQILPLISRLLPVSALQTIALAIEVDALTEQLDALMVAELDRVGVIDRIDETSYSAAYRRVDRRDDRLRQIALIRATGDALEKLAQKPLLGALLKLMRGPAELAGLAELQIFLENGLAAFRRMGQADAFLDCIEWRERMLLDKLFSGAEQPFAP